MRARALAYGFARPPWPWLFAVAGFGLILSAFAEGRSALVALCGDGTVRLLATLGWRGTLTLMADPDQIARLVADWILMLLAMMPPLLAASLTYVWRSSLPRRRTAAVCWFVVGYGAVWMMSGPILAGVGLLLQLLAGDAALVVACLLAAIWSASPVQRRALNRGHRVRHIGVFGWMAYRDCLTFGVIHGGWCLVSCWAWMVVPLVAGSWHFPAMVLVGLVMLGERLTLPSEPRWRVPAFLSPLNAAALAARRQAGAHRG